MTKTTITILTTAITTALEITLTPPTTTLTVSTTTMQKTTMLSPTDCEVLRRRLVQKTFDQGNVDSSAFFHSTFLPFVFESDGVVERA